MSTRKVRGVRNSKRGPIKLSSNSRFTASRSGIIASKGSRQINVIVFLLLSIFERSLEAHHHWLASTIYGSTLALRSHHKNGFPSHILATIPSQDCFPCHSLITLLSQDNP